jgi:hypothetical protein
MVDNVLARLEFLVRAGQSYRPEAEFCASHLHEIDRSELSRVNFEVLDSLLSQNCLRVKSEHSLYEIIRDRCSTDLAFSNLLSHL